MAARQWKGVSCILPWHFPLTLLVGLLPLAAAPPPLDGDHRCHGTLPLSALPSLRYLDCSTVQLKACSPCCCAWLPVSVLTGWQDLHSRCVNQDVQAISSEPAVIYYTFTDSLPCGCVHHTTLQGAGTSSVPPPSQTGVE